jgi:hypothetical protein
MAIGLDHLNARLSALLETTGVPRWLGVCGDYGAGKSFFRALACKRALAAGYAVAYFDVNKDEGALHQPQRHFSTILSSLRSPRPEFEHFFGFHELLRVWFQASPLESIASVLRRMHNTPLWHPAGRDPGQFTYLAGQIISAAANTHGVDGPRSPNSVDGQGRQVIQDAAGNLYSWDPQSALVFRKAVHQRAWFLYGGPRDWRLLTSGQNCGPLGLGDSFSRAAGQASCISQLITFLSGDDLVTKGAYARFAAAHRFQLLNEWLLATGHRGLFLFIDEVDNVLRQIHGKGHPACFRTMAWYCSCPAIPRVRVVFAATPEVKEFLNANGRSYFSEALSQQETVHSVELDVYERWRAEADDQGLNAWGECHSLTTDERIELYRRVAHIHRTAWGNPRVHVREADLAKLASSGKFNTTRRWVRAAVQLLDLLHLHEAILKTRSIRKER